MLPRWGGWWEAQGTGCCGSEQLCQPVCWGEAGDLIRGFSFPPFRSGDALKLEVIWKEEEVDRTEFAKVLISSSVALAGK